MKNLFDYATSELSQDAFLCWLFANYDCENEVVKKAAHALLGEMTDIKDLKVGTVTELAVERQVNHTDIVVSFTHTEKRYILVIEDKTFSREHDQFETYPENIKKRLKDQNARYFFAFYKTDIVDKDEKERAEKSHTWKAFYLKEIYNFFASIPDSKCLIFEQYKEHIFDLYKKTSSVSDKAMKDWKDLLLFRTYIIQELFPLLKAKKDILEDPVLTGWHSYRSLVVKRRKTGDDITFSLEIVFRPAGECANAIVRLFRGEEQKAEEELREGIRKCLTDTNVFKGHNSKWCVAQGTRPFSYVSGKNQVKQDCKETINAFASICEQLNAKLRNQ